MPCNVTNVADYLELLIKRGIFVDILTDQEVCNMTMAQFSREDILRYQGREEGEMIGELRGELRGELIGAVRTYQKLNVPQETARQYIMEEFGKSEEEADALLSAYWK